MGPKYSGGAPGGFFARRPARLNTAIAAALPIGLHHDGACAAFERAADPLHCARIDTEAFRNDAHTWSPTNRQGLTDSFFKCGSNWGAPQALPLALGPRKPGTDSFLNDGPCRQLQVFPDG